MDKTLTNKQQYMYEANNTCKHCKPLARLAESESGMADAKKVYHLQLTKMLVLVGSSGNKLDIDKQLQTHMHARNIMHIYYTHTYIHSCIHTGTHTYIHTYRQTD